MSRRDQNRLTTVLPFAVLVGGAVLFALRARDLWRNPYQVGRVWQSFDIARELERVHGIPWKTELSPMTGGNLPAPFVQEFPFPQYAVLPVRQLTGLSVADAGQAVAILTAVLIAVIWFLYARSLSVSRGVRLLVGALIFFVPAYLRFGAVAVPDASVFLLNLGGVCLVATGRRKGQSSLILWGAALVGISVLAKTTALPAAAMVGVALLIDRNWRAVATLAVATLPGLAWAAMGQTVNKAAVSVNYFARLATIREYWWNPKLYTDPWWARSVAFTLYDALGVFGVVVLAWVILRVRKRPFELVLMLLPAAITIVAFDYHSASHRYYTLIWLPFVLVACVELAADRLKSLERPALMTAVVVLAVLGIAERGSGVVERFVAHQPDAVDPFFHSRPIDAIRARADAASHTALADVKATGGPFVGYLGNSWMPFLDLGVRGWIVEASSDEAVEQRRTHVPVSVTRAQERFRLGEDWFRDRRARGMSAVLIERGGAFDNPEVIGWAEAAGLRPAEVQPPGHVLLRSY